MHLTSTETKERSVVVPVPSFWKEDKYGIADYIAVLNEQTAVNVFKSEDYTVVKHSTPFRMKDSIVQAIESWQSISEEEFLTAYSEALKSISLIKIKAPA